MKKRKYLRKIPLEILHRIRQHNGESIRVGQLFATANPEFEAIVKKFGLQLDGQTISCPDPLPKVSSGPWSKKNANGWVEVHKDQDKEPFSYTITTPNFGDPAKGYHDIEMVRMRYPRTNHGAKLLAFEFRLLKIGGLDFVEVYLDKEIPIAADYEDELFFQLNLFCENIGSCDILLEGEQLRARVRNVAWEIFPTLPLEEIQERLTATIPDPARRRQAEEIVAARYNFFQSLNPTDIIVGADGFTRYFGAVFQEKVALFECINYGNAIYLLGENWRELTQLSRTQLLTTPGLNFERIVHKGAWMAKARREMERLLREIDEGPDEPPAAQPIAV